MFKELFSSCHGGIISLQIYISAWYVSLLSLLTASPKIIEPRNNQVKLVTEGESISIACTAKGFPFPQVTWLTTDKVVKYTGDGSDIIGESYESLPNISSILEIEDIVPELTGNYSCQAFPSNFTGMPPINSTEVQIQVTVSGELLYSKYTKWSSVLCA